VSLAGDGYHTPELEQLGVDHQEVVHSSVGIKSQKWAEAHLEISLKES
jgi:hypothetical protein